MEAMVLIVGDFPQFYTLWDNFFAYMATAVLAYGCGLAHGIIGYWILQYLKREKRPTNSTQTNEAPPANVAIPNNVLGEQLPVRQPMPPMPPMPAAEPIVRIRQTVPPTISVGMGETTYAYHNAKVPCRNHAEYARTPRYKTRRFSPCKDCYPDFYSR